MKKTSSREPELKFYSAFFFFFFWHLFSVPCWCPSDILTPFKSRFSHCYLRHLCNFSHRGLKNFLWLKMSSNNNKNKKNDDTFFFCLALFMRLKDTLHLNIKVIHYRDKYHKSNKLQANLKTYIIQHLSHVIKRNFEKVSSEISFTDKHTYLKCCC